MEKGFFGQYSGNARHSRTPVTKKNYRASVADDAAHIHYLKMDIDYDAKHGHSDKDMTADEKHISKLAGDMKYDKKHHSPLGLHKTDPKTGKPIPHEFIDVGPGDFGEPSISYDEEAPSRIFFGAQKQAQNALNLAQRQLDGEEVFSRSVPGMGSLAATGPQAAQAIVGYTSGEDGNETVGGGGRVSFNRQGVQDEINRLQQLVNTNPVEARSIISRRLQYGTSRMGDSFANRFNKYVDPLQRNK